MDTRPCRCHNHGVPPVFVSWARLVRLAVVPAGLAIAVGGFLIARGPGSVTTYAGRSWLATGLTVAAGLTLVLAGLLASYTSRPGPAGDLALIAGLVWFAPVWVGWEFGPMVVRSLAMLVAGFVFAPSQGNNQILVVLNASQVVQLGGPAHLTNHGVAQPVDPRLLMLKSPMMNGADVEAVQQALNQRNHAGVATDGVYNPATRDAVVNWQRHEQIEVDGIVGPHTRSTLGLPASTHVPA